MILIIDDCKMKIIPIIIRLEKIGIEYKITETYQETVDFIKNNSDKIEGIILDMCFKHDDNTVHSDIKEGLNVLYTMVEKSHKIPVLINSSTYVSDDELPMKVFGQIEPGGTLKPFSSFMNYCLGNVNYAV